MALTPEELARYQAFAQNPNPSQTSGLAQWGKTLGRAALDTRTMINQAAAGLSDVAGKAIGVPVAQNPVSTFFNQNAEASGTMAQGYAPSQAADVQAGRMTPIQTPFTQDEEWAKEHNVQSKLQEIAQGAVPSAVALMGGLPVAAGVMGLSSYGKNVQKQIDQGTDENTAMQRAILPAVGEGALFGLMGHALRPIAGGLEKVAGTEVTNALGESVSKMEFQPGIAHDLLAKVSPKAATTLFGETGPVSKVTREALTAGPYMYGQGQVVQGLEAASGVTTKDEYLRNLGIDPNQGALPNTVNLLKKQGTDLATSMLTGGLFGLMHPSEQYQRKFNNQLHVSMSAHDDSTALPTGVPPTEAPSPIVTDAVTKARQEAQDALAQQQAQTKAQEDAQVAQQHRQTLDDITPVIKAKEATSETLSQLIDIADSSPDPKLKKEAASLIPQVHELLAKQATEGHQATIDAAEATLEAKQKALEHGDNISAATTDHNKAVADIAVAEAKVTELTRTLNKAANAKTEEHQDYLSPSEKVKVQADLDKAEQDLAHKQQLANTARENELHTRTTADTILGTDTVNATDSNVATSPKDQLVQQGRAHVDADGVYHLHHKEDSTNMAGYNPKHNTIHINDVRAQEAFDNRNNPEPIKNKTKQAMYEMLGTTHQKFMSVFKDIQEFHSFLKAHEWFHRDNNHVDMYPRLENGKLDKDHVDAIALESDATYYGLAKAQRKQAGIQERSAPFMSYAKDLITTKGVYEADKSSYLVSIATRLYKGTKNFVDFSKAMVKALGDNVKPYLMKLFAYAKGIKGFAVEPMSEKQALLKMTPEQRVEYFKEKANKLSEPIQDKKVASLATIDKKIQDIIDLNGGIEDDTKRQVYVMSDLEKLAYSFPKESTEAKHVWSKYFDVKKSGITSDSRGTINNKSDTQIQEPVKKPLSLADIRKMTPQEKMEAAKAANKEKIDKLMRETGPPTLHQQEWASDLSWINKSKERQNQLLLKKNERESQAFHEHMIEEAETHLADLKEKYPDIKDWEKPLKTEMSPVDFEAHKAIEHYLDELESEGEEARLRRSETDHRQLNDEEPSTSVKRGSAFAKNIPETESEITARPKGVVGATSEDTENRKVSLQRAAIGDEYKALQMRDEGKTQSKTTIDANNRKVIDDVTKQLKASSLDPYYQQEILDGLEFANPHIKLESLASQLLEKEGVDSFNKLKGVPENAMDYLTGLSNSLAGIDEKGSDKPLTLGERLRKTDLRAKEEIEKQGNYTLPERNQINRLYEEQRQLEFQLYGQPGELKQTIVRGARRTELLTRLETIQDSLRKLSDAANDRRYDEFKAQPKVDGGKAIEERLKKSVGSLDTDTRNTEISQVVTFIEQLRKQFGNAKKPIDLLTYIVNRTKIPEQRVREYLDAMNMKYENPNASKEIQAITDKLKAESTTYSTSDLVDKVKNAPEIDRSASLEYQKYPKTLTDTEEGVVQGVELKRTFAPDLELERVDANNLQREINRLWENRVSLLNLRNSTHLIDLQKKLQKATTPEEFAAIHAELIHYQASNTNAVTPRNALLFSDPHSLPQSLAIASLAETLGVHVPESYTSIAESIKGLKGEAKDTAVEQLRSMQTQLKTDILQKYFDNKVFAKPEHIEDAVRNLKDYGITMSKGELYQVLHDSNYDVAKFNAQVNRVIDAKLQSASDVTALMLKEANAKGVEARVATDAITSLLGKEHTPEAASFADYLKGKDIPPEHTEALAPIVDLHNTIKALREAEKTSIDESKSTTLASEKAATNLPISTPDIVRTKDPLTHTLDEKLIAQQLGATIGVLRNKYVQTFFEKVANLFGAKLVVTSGHDEPGMYFPKGHRGLENSTLMVNADTGFNFTRIFAHELWHHVENKLNPFTSQALTKAVLDNIDPSVYNKILGDYAKKQGNATTAELQSEFHADLLASAIHSSQFWKALSDKAPGLGQRLLIRLASHFASVHKFLDGEQKGIYETDQLFQNHNEVYRQFANMLFGAQGNEGHLNSLEAKFFKNSVYDETKEKVVNEFNKMMPEGSATWKTVIPSVLKYIKELAPMKAASNMISKVFGDFGAKPEDKADAYYAQNRPRVYTAEIAQQLKKYTDTFKLRGEAEQISFQNALRGFRQDEEGNLIKVDGKYKKEKTPDFDFIEKKFGKEAVDFLKDADQLAKTQYEKLKGLYPDLPEIANHYGQSLKYYRKGILSDNELDRTNDPAYSKLEGEKQYAKRRSSLPLQDILHGLDENGVRNEDRRLEPKDLNPITVLLTYLHDTEQVLALRELRTRMLSEGRAKIFYNDIDALHAKMFPVNDNGMNIFSRLNHDTGFRIKMEDGTYMQRKDGKDSVFASEDDARATIDGHEHLAGASVESLDTTKHSGEEHIAKYNVLDERDNVVNHFDRLEDAQKYADEHDMTVQPVRLSDTGQNADLPIAKLYFSKGFARMMNNMLSKDYIRDNYFGHKALMIKNQYTAWELGMSLFHAFTVGQEATSAYASWGVLGNKGSLISKIPILNAVKVYKNTRNLNELYEKCLLDKNYAQSAEGKKAVRELLGNNVDFKDLIDHFHLAGGTMKQDVGVSTRGDAHEIDYSNIRKTFSEVYKFEQRQAEEKGGFSIKPELTAANLAVIQLPTQWLFEKAIPKLKFAQFAREFSLKLEKAGDNISEAMKQNLAQDTVKFVDNRFGETNWDNLWMNKSVKTSLQMMMRSFTWIQGTYAAFGKAGHDLVKEGWLKSTGTKEFEMTDKSMWAVMAVASHMFTAAAITGLYAGYTAMSSGTEDTSEDKGVPNLTKLLFPRIDPYDSSKRVSIPSYVTELYKIISHLGLGTAPFEPSKLISGRFNGVVSKAIDIAKNQDFKGTYIIDPNDGPLAKTYDALKYLFPTPISMGNIGTAYQSTGHVSAKDVASGVMGLTEAPAYAKRSSATNYAFEKSREQFMGRVSSHDREDHNMAVKRAMYDVSQGDHSTIQKMLSNGEISPNEYKTQMQRARIIDGQPNPQHKDVIVDVVKHRLDMEAALAVYKKADAEEKIKLRPVINAKFNDMIGRDTKSRVYKLQMQKEMHQVGLR